MQAIQNLSALISPTGYRLDRRGSPRTAANGDTTWLVGRGNILGEVIDLAPRGAFLRAVGPALKKFQIGDRVRLGIRLPGKQNLIYLWAVVRRKGASFSHGGQGFGVEFEKPQYQLFNQFWRPSTVSNSSVGP